MKISTFLPLHASRAQGWIFLVLGFSMFSGFLYAAIIAKFLPVSENHIVAAIQNDRCLRWMVGDTPVVKSLHLAMDRPLYTHTNVYYCFLVPLTIPIVIVAVYFHWLSMKLFKHA